jgi:DNA-binding NtrC family response regulator
MPPRILVVDDDEAALNGLARLLRDDGYDVIACARPREALSCLGARHFDAVITDLEMPEIDGAAVAQRACIEQPGVPLFLISANALGSRVALAHATRTFDKPVDYDELERALRSCLSGS